MATRLNSVSKHVLYFYGVSEVLPEKVAAVGVDLKSAVEPMPCDGLVCWVSRVSAVEYGDELPKNMENLDWLAPASVAHQRAIAAIAANSDVLPARFGIVFRDERSLLEHIRQRSGTLREDFKRVKGADEWGVKVFAEQAKQKPAKKSRSGRDYLMAKAALLPGSDRGAESDEDLNGFRRALEALAQETAPPGNVSRGQRGMVLQATLLVKRTKRARLESILKKFMERWKGVRRIECTGPWPPYSFISRDEK